MKTDSDIPNTTVSHDELDSLFRVLDIVNVSALWVDKDFKTYKYNKANKFVDEAVIDANGEELDYKDLIYEIYQKNHVCTKQESNRNVQQSWIKKLKELQATPLNPTEDSVVLSSSGNRFTSRRVFLPDGSMIVISFEYSEFLHRDDIIKIAFNMSKSGALCYTKSSGEFFVESPYLQRILTADEYFAVKDKGLFAIIHPDDRQSARDIFSRSLNSNTPITKNIRIKTRNKGSLWFKFTGRLERIHGKEPKRHILTFEDITEELEVQENLRKHIQKSENELKERLDFIAKLSHELKTPMNAIVGLSDALLHDDIPEVTRKKLELIQLSSESLLGMLDDTLNHAKLKSANATLDLQYVDAQKVVGNICKLWEHQALKKGTTIKFHPSEDLPKSIKLDRVRIAQCLNNLISNAAKFTEYGRIDVILRPHYAENNTPKLAIAVRDNGIGMTESQQEQVFQAYKQANETISTRFGGTGLGLSITKDLVELMGGKITLSSKPDEGSLFLIVLPMETEASGADVPDKPELDTNITPIPPVKEPVKPKAQVLLPEASKAPSPNRKVIKKENINTKALEKLNVLVVDDNETNHIVMSSLLENIVSGIYSANNGQEALDVLAVEHIDIVLMDIHMPVMDGIEATLAIRQSSEHFSDVRIIALTADPQYQQQRLCVNIGMDEAIAKPVKLVDLIDVIKKTLISPVNTLAKAS